MKTASKPRPRSAAIEAAGVELVKLLVAAQGLAERMEPSLERHTAACTDPWCDYCHLLEVLAKVGLDVNDLAVRVNSCLMAGRVDDVPAAPHYRRRR